ncbi:MAG TPA: hypothetical protein VMN39_09270 [Longimicrobiaceae bacterium]|nr:hypothetical protein [Longimicrobiaceae bacterium]
MTRAEAATKLCQRLTSEVSAIAPVGLGHWPETWEIVGDADSAFMLALVGWERTGSEADRVKVRDAYNRVLDAWREAARRYEEQPT